MDAIWGPLGVVVGCLLAIGGKVMLHTEESSAATRNERKRLYIALLAAARQLWSFARSARSFAREDLDDHPTRPSIANYEMELLASSAIAVAADQLRRRILDYVNLAPESSEQFESYASRQERLAGPRQAARDASEAFIKITRSDLQRKKLTNDSSHAGVVVISVPSLQSRSLTRWAGFPAIFSVSASKEMRLRNDLSYSFRANRRHWTTLGVVAA